jgi:hypothetical protein
MPYPHRIRLRGPWEFEPLSRSVVQADGDAAEVQSDLPRAGKIALPADWGPAVGPDFRGRVRFRRRFGRPAELDPHERAWLVCEGVDARGTLTCNGRQLGPVRGYALPAAFDISELLAPRNELWLDVELPSAIGNSQIVRPGREGLPGGPIGEVRLEIRSVHFLDDLSLTLGNGASDSQFLLCGVLSGPPAQGLEIVVRGPAGELLHSPLAGHQLAPKLAASAAMGQPFSFALPAAGLPSWMAEPAQAGARLGQVEVRLLHGGIRLFEAKFSTALRTLAVDPDAGRLEVAGRPIALPVPRVDRLHCAAMSMWPAAVMSASIDESLLMDCDKQGIAVIQSMPPAWAAEVCPRLAHHPSVVAWVAPAPALPAIAPDQRSAYFGRPWFALEAAAVPPIDSAESPVATDH